MSEKLERLRGKKGPRVEPRKAFNGFPSAYFLRENEGKGPGNGLGPTAAYFPQEFCI